MHLATIMTRKLTLFLAIGFCLMPALQAGNFPSQDHSDPSTIKKVCNAWRNSVRWFANTSKKTLILGLLATHVPKIESQVGTEFMLNDPSASDLTNPGIVGWPDGHLYAVWQQGSISSFRAINEDGSLLTSEIPVSNLTSQLWPTISSFNDSSAAVAWVDSNNNFKARLFNRNGIGESSDLQIAAGGQGSYNNPSINAVPLVNGNVLLSFENIGSSNQFFGQEINQGGSLKLPYRTNWIVLVDGPILLQPQTLMGTSFLLTIMVI